MFDERLGQFRTLEPLKLVLWNQELAKHGVFLLEAGVR